MGGIYWTEKEKKLTDAKVTDLKDKGKMADEELSKIRRKFF